ncbi:MAG: UDP-N-acetylmuramate--L-alanine ligase [bacterium]|nr:UDP-N-acetylmuramate--L-alanine ligase [bacterium]
MKKVHFMGVGGSGANAAASIADAMGFEVSGCDMKESEYTHDLQKNSIPLSVGHDIAHLKNIDILCVSPALFDVQPRPDEMKEAMKHGITIQTWQEFMGIYLQKEKDVVAIAGTKGKSTTTSLMGVLLETAGLDPLVQVGAKVIDWQKNYRLGNGKYFVCEADEFNNNFLHYRPKIAVITNLEMDHPEFFKSFDAYLDSFVSFTRMLPEDGVLVANTDSHGVQQLLSLLGEVPFRVFTYGTAQSVDILLESEETVDGMTSFTLSGYEDEPSHFLTKLTGSHNISNILAIISVASILDIPASVVRDTLASFSGIGRRFELICDVGGIKVFNDYAHNPMSVAAALQGARSRYPDSRVWAVFQPHMYTRTKMFLEEFAHSFNDANEVIVLEIFASREKGSPIAQEIDSQALVDRIFNVNPKLHVRSIPAKEKAVEVLLAELKTGDIVVNMGAGDNGIITEMLKSKL